MEHATLELLPGQSLTLLVPASVQSFRWPVAAFRVACATPQPLYRDPYLQLPVLTAAGAPRLTPALPMDVYAVFAGERALLVWPHPPLWIDGDAAHVVS